MAQKLTQKEIARKFELPERKSKLAFLLKNEPAFDCMCKSQNTSLFIIECDDCGRKYHGSCLGLTEQKYKAFERYVCPLCQEDSVLFKGTSETKHKSTTAKSRCKKSATKLLRTSDLGHTSCYKAGGKSTGLDNKQESSNNKESKKDRSSKKSSSKRKGNVEYTPDIVTQQQTKKSTVRVLPQTEDDDVASNILLKNGRHCYGPGCIESARPNSKYCSDKCGMKLATNRILQILPLRVQEWSMTPSIAERSDQKALEEVRKKQAEVHLALKDLEQRSMRLEAIIENGKTLETNMSLDSEQLKQVSKKKKLLLQDEKDDSSIYCVTCGQEIHTISAIKHMEKCFMKYESQSSFSSMYKTMVQGSDIFCDFYNPLTKTYCKRLKVICPEHTKEPIVSVNEACGNPLMNNLFQETEELCRTPKRICYKHFSWEKIRRAEIDLEKVRYWLKIDELVQEEAQIRQRMTQRAGVLALLLHSTYDHDALEEMTSAQEEERLALLEKTLRENYCKEQFENISKEHKKFIKSIEKTVQG